MRAITGAPVADCTSGFRCWRRDALGRIPLDRLASNGYAFLIETLHEALRRGARIGEVPIVFVERSKVSLNALAESLIMPWRARFRPRLRRATRRSTTSAVRAGARQPRRRTRAERATASRQYGMHPALPDSEPPQPAVVAGNSVP